MDEARLILLIFDGFFFGNGRLRGVRVSRRNFSIYEDDRVVFSRKFVYEVKVERCLKLFVKVFI